MPASTSGRQKRTRSRALRIVGLILKIAVSTACLVYVFRWLGDVGDAVEPDGLLRRWSWLVAGLLCAGISIGLEAWRWRVMLTAQGLDVSWLRVVYVCLVGLGVGLVSLGAIATDGTKLLMLCRQFPDRKVAVGISIAADHIAGAVISLAFALAFTVTAFTKLNATGIEARALLIFAGFAFGGMLMMVVVLSWLTSPPMRRFAAKILPRLLGNDTTQSTMAAYDLLRTRWPATLKAIALSVPMLTAYFAVFFCGLRAAGGEVGFGSVLAAMPVVDLVASMPVSLAGLGVREGAFGVLMETLTGVAPAMAAVGSLIGFGMTAFWGAIGGLWLLRRGDSVKIDTEIEN